MSVRRVLFAVGAVLLLALPVRAAGPRWVAGPQWQNNGQIINWYRTDVQYFVDAGALSASVNHAAAVALVDAAAAVWNVPSVPFTLKDGGALSEDVSSSNVYLASSGAVWPSDVASSNYTAKQIAVVMDADGSVTDMLLGGGASSPSNCRQAAVTESVDLFIQPGRIAHAVLVLNGRCTGPAPEQQMQMQYQLMRAFGRVIGIGWSQTNDNVFTGSPAPTVGQLMHWPIMHPIDILCGLYSYQCLPQPFTLRDDDTAALRLVYAASSVVPDGTAEIVGAVLFPDGLRMNGVNVAATRNYNGQDIDGFQDVTSVLGYLWRADSGDPVTGGPVDMLGITGSPDPSQAGLFLFFSMPILQQFPSTGVVLATEPINPLYTGMYAVGPYRMAQVAPSGSGLTSTINALASGSNYSVGLLPVVDAASVCNPSADGTENAPSPLLAGGTWNGLLCGVGHSAWSSFAVQAGRTATLEVTATDEQSLVSGAKALPVVGLWHATDATGALPTMAATPSALNTSHIGMTQLHVSFSATENVRMAIADQRGDGRPDYTYRARLLYADTVLPAQVPAGGGPIRIVGMGFAQGNTVTVGGVLAQVTSVTATEIDAIVPPLSGTANVVVTDLSTGGTASIAGGLTYLAPTADVLSMTLTPGGSSLIGVAVPFALKVVDPNGRAVANASIAVAVSGAGASLSTCLLAACALATDANGAAQATVTGSTAGTVVLKASISDGSSVSDSWIVVPVRVVSFARPVQYVAAGAGAVFTPSVMLTEGGNAAAGQSVAWSASSVRIALGSASVVSASNGLASVRATGSLNDGEAATVQACAWTTVCATENVVGVAAGDLRVVVVAGDAQRAGAGAMLQPVSFRVVDVAGRAVSGAAVMVYQAVMGWQPPCVVGRCPPAPVYGTSKGGAMSDDDGNVLVVPLQYANTAAVTKITVAAGTQGEATATLQKTPN